MWNVILHRSVLHDDLKKIDRAEKRVILKAIHKKLSRDPEQYGTPLAGEYRGHWKLRVGDYRVIYRIVKDKILVVIIKIGIRRDNKIYNELFYRLKKM